MFTKTSLIIDTLHHYLHYPYILKFFFLCLPSLNSCPQRNLDIPLHVCTRVHKQNARCLLSTVYLSLVIYMWITSIFLSNLLCHQTIKSVVLRIHGGQSHRLYGVIRLTINKLEFFLERKVY